MRHALYQTNYQMQADMIFPSVGGVRRSRGEGFPQTRVATRPAPSRRRYRARGPPRPGGESAPTNADTCYHNNDVVYEHRDDVVLEHRYTYAHDGHEIPLLGRVHVATHDGHEIPLRGRGPA